MSALMASAFFAIIPRRIQINASAVRFGRRITIHQLIRALGVIEQHCGRRAPQLRVKGHVLLQRRSRKRGFERKELIRVLWVLSDVAGVDSVVVAVENFFVFRGGYLTGFAIRGLSHG